MKRPRKATIERVKNGFLVVLSHRGAAWGTVVGTLDYAIERIEHFLKTGATNWNRTK